MLLESVVVVDTLEADFDRGALVPYGAADPPRQRGDALGQHRLDGTDRFERGDDALEMRLPLLCRLAGDDERAGRSGRGAAR